MLPDRQGWASGGGSGGGRRWPSTSAASRRSLRNCIAALPSTSGALTPGFAGRHHLRRRPVTALRPCSALRAASERSVAAVTPLKNADGLAASARGGRQHSAPGPGKLAGKMRSRRKVYWPNDHCVECFLPQHRPSTAQRCERQSPCMELASALNQVSTTAIDLYTSCYSTQDCRLVMLHAAAASVCRQSCSASRRRQRRHSCKASQPSPLAPRQPCSGIMRRMVCRRVQQGGAGGVTEHVCARRDTACCSIAPTSCTAVPLRLLYWPAQTMGACPASPAARCDSWVAAAYAGRQAVLRTWEWAIDATLPAGHHYFTVPRLIGSSPGNGAAGKGAGKCDSEVEAACLLRSRHALLGSTTGTASMGTP